MVKNITGGNKSKKHARKGNAQLMPLSAQNVRKALEEGEIYAIVTKIYGGSNCQVMCNDGVTRSCVIRNKFKTFGRRDNTISLGCWILAGIRVWEVRAGGPKCDLLEVYSQNEKDKLQQIETCSFKFLIHAVDEHKEDKNSELVFSNTAETSSNTIQTELLSSSDDDDDDVKMKPKEKVVSLKDLLSTKTNKNHNEQHNQNDWLKQQINVNDI
jgi:hypothetical protein